MTLTQIYLNNLDTAAEYAVRLVDELLAGEALQQSFFLETELERARIAMLGVRGVEDKFRGVLKVRGLLVLALSYWTPS